MFWPFLGSDGAPRVPEGLQWFTIECHENLGQNLKLWEDFPIANLGVTHLEGGKKISDDLRHVSAVFRL